MKRSVSLQNFEELLADSDSEHDERGINNNSSKPLSQKIKRFKNIFFKTQDIKPDYTQFLHIYKRVKESLFAFLQDETKVSKFIGAREDLDYLLFLIEKHLSITKKPSKDFYEFAAKSSSLRASCALIKASEHNSEQILECENAIKYMELARGYGFPDEKSIQTIENYLNTLKERRHELSKTIESYNHKNRSQAKDLLMYRSLWAGTCEKNLGGSLKNYYLNGFIELNQQINGSAKEIMINTLSSCSLEESEVSKQLDFIKT